MIGNSLDPKRSNVIVGVALAIVLLTICRFVAALMGAASEGEVAGALGNLLGGMIGAGGALLAVYLALSAQTKEETGKVAAAVRTEVASLVTYIIGAIEICEHIATKTRQVPRKDASYVIRKLVAEPVVYKAVADRIGLLPHPNATVQFYMRLSEARAMVESLQIANITQQYLSSENAETIADSLITALQLAQSILARDGSPHLAELVTQEMVGQMEACLQSAKVTFPNALSFQP